MSDHPLNIYKDYFEEFKNKILLKLLLKDNETNGYVAGTIMSIQEKKSAKGTPLL